MCRLSRVLYQVGQADEQFKVAMRCMFAMCHAHWDVILAKGPSLLVMHGQDIVVQSHGQYFKHLYCNLNWNDGMTPPIL